MSSPITDLIKVSEDLRIPFQDIKEATKNFKTPIGRGGYGSVYKGELLLSDKLTSVAVKRLEKNRSGQGSKQFLNELDLLSCYKHKNLVSLRGFCDEDGEKILIYDYAEHGSLEKYLNKGKSLVQLTWLQRINICIDAARGLDYLHNHVAEHLRIIHGDIKSANILINHDWRALIADFGLSKISHANVDRSYIITHAFGTPGYFEPEFVNSGVLTKESDVYSFGVVLFEVLCGRLGYIDVEGERLALLAKRYYEEGRLSAIIDPFLKSGAYSDSLKRFSDIAYQCLFEKRKERPPINSVLIELEAVAEMLIGPHENIQGYNNEKLKANDLPSNAIPKLQLEFKQILSLCSKPVEPYRIFECLPSSVRPSYGVPDASNKGPSNSHTAVYTPLVLVPPRLMPVLHDLAQDMVNAGYTQQCPIIYRDARSRPLQKSLRQLGVEKLSEGDIQKMEWEVLELKVGTWIHSMRIAVNLLFAAERKFCDQMFEGIKSLEVKDHCFATVTQDSLDMLLGFGNAVAKRTSSPEKLFVLLDMYEIMRELYSKIEMDFSGKACKEIRGAALDLTKGLAQTAKDTFGDFEAVEKDTTRTAVADGTVHPLTSYVINYVKLLFDYQSILKQLFQELEVGDDSNCQLAYVIMRIMQALQTNLEGKSKQYKDPALSNLFIMNNIHHVVRSVRRSEAKDLLGDKWVQQHRRIVQQHANQYKRISWFKILQSLSIQGAGLSGGDVGNSSGALRALVKDRLNIFNDQFEVLHQRQSEWLVPDRELRESLRLAIAEVLLPAYKAFIEQFGSLVENEKNNHKYIRYSSEDLDRMVGEFFKGKP